MELNTIDLFCGAGGLSLGFELEGFNVIAGVDNHESYLETFKDSHNNSKPIKHDLSDDGIKKILQKNDINTDNIDVVIGGPPCQGFSTAGNRMIEDSRNKLVIEFCKSIKELNPRAFLMENVTGLTSMKNGVGELVVEELTDLFGELGYNVDYKVLSASDFGVPQLRKRLFIVGIRDEVKFNWPKNTHFRKGPLDTFVETNGKKDYLTVRQAISDLPSLNPGEKKEKYISEPKTDYQKWARNDENKLKNHSAPNHSKIVIKRIKNIPQGGNHSDLPEELQLNSGYPNIYGKLSWDSPSDTITGNFGCASAPGRFLHPKDNRVLSVREGARLQSFPDTVKFYGSKSDQYQQVGNAVPPLLVKSLAKSIKRCI